MRGTACSTSRAPAADLPVGAAPEPLRLVSCIMATCDRRAFVPRAIALFLRQDYPQRELVVVDDGTDRIADLIPADPRIRYLALAGRRSLGSKLNLACQEARGEIIVHWDDDDWQAARRVRYQVSVLQARQADICGIDRPLYYDPAQGRAWQYIYPTGYTPWVAGGTLCYTRRFWLGQPFPATGRAVTNRFQWQGARKTVATLPDPTCYICLIHPGNTSPKQTDHPNWQPYPVAALQALMEADEAS